MCGNDTNLAIMIGLFEIVQNELKKIPHKLLDQVVSARLEMSLKKKPLAKAHALFYKGLKAVGGSESKINVVYGKVQISFLVGSAVAAKYTLEGEGLAGEGWSIKFDVIEAIFIVKSSSITSSWFRLNPACPVDTWQLISMNVNRQRSFDISIIKEILLGPAHACADSPAILSILETKSWDVTNLELLGYVCYGSTSGFATLLVSTQFCTIERSWKF